MNFFKTTTNTPVKSTLNYLPSAEKIAIAIGAGIGTGLAVLSRVNIYTVMSRNNSYCADAKFDNLASAMLQASLQALLLSVGFSGLLQIQEALGVNRASPIIFAQICLLWLGLTMIIKQAELTVPIAQCINTLEDPNEQICKFFG